MISRKKGTNLGDKSSLEIFIGFELASLIIPEKSFISPYNILYEFPFSPCFLNNFSNFFGLNQTQFSTFHRHTNRATAMTQQHIVTNIWILSILFELNLCVHINYYYIFISTMFVDIDEQRQISEDFFVIIILKNIDWIPTLHTSQQCKTVIHLACHWKNHRK